MNFRMCPVHFRHKEVVVYPENLDKPAVGQGLNVPAEISLERVWPIDKTTGDPIKYGPKLQEMNYEGVLRKACLRLDADFISYNPDGGVWIFKVSSFVEQQNLQAFKK
jgi:nuclear pore complex protein Nup98-Nup96